MTALLLTLLSLVIATALLYTVTSGMKATASHKRYKNSLAAAHGGVELLMKDVVPRIFDNKSPQQIESDLNGVNLHFTEPNGSCMQQKITLETAQWDACTPQRLTSDPGFSPDLTFTLLGTSAPDFTVATKITDTVPGNTFTAGGTLILDSASAVAGADDPVIHPEHVPYLYTFVVQGERGGDTPEKARLSVLYAY